ncbi:hypothetical protein [Rhizobium leguminosarum]|uniref:hypothetical protein n=1 Tax=Rhizobium leguminosarum TaxID=384 RepID=UPI001C90C965|nr:hypothetical protein [Rhizobium leguminosarum]MBY2919467.1 hypothetical protein [Rhizobium leguminosarum]MBY2975074.1 hypothetical protein [Rhizobium leguminosarum]MBY2981807.1 hypothetical protein [Rhizobium leguminosarum]MBY3011022.1 hypothetical protein [Rhizobium leguminosarum]
MHILSGLFANLKLRYKLASGLSAILAAVVGGVGYIAIDNLSSRFAFVSVSTEVANQMQATSVKREQFLFNPSAVGVDATRTQIKELFGALGASSKQVQGNTAMTIEVGEAKAAAKQFASTFDKVTAETSREEEHLAILQNSVSSLESQAAAINAAVGQEEA